MVDASTATSSSPQSAPQLSETAANAFKEAAAAVKNNRDAVKKFMEVNLKKGYAYLRDYMLTFAGKEEADKIQLGDVVVQFLKKGTEDPYSIAEYKSWKY